MELPNAWGPNSAIVEKNSSKTAKSIQNITNTPPAGSQVALLITNRNTISAPKSTPESEGLSASH